MLGTEVVQKVHLSLYSFEVPVGGIYLRPNQKQIHHGRERFGRIRLHVITNLYVRARVCFETRTVG